MLRYRSASIDSGKRQSARIIRHVAISITPAAYFLGILTQYRWYFLCLLLLAATSVACDWHQTGLWPRLERVLTPLIFFLLCLAASSTWALQPLATLQGLALPLTYTALTICAARWSQEQPLRRQTQPFIVLIWAVAAAVAYVYVRFGSLKPVNVDIKAAFGAGSNAAAAHVLVAIPFLMWRLRTHARLMDIATLVLALGLLLMSQTRAAYVITPVIVAISLARPSTFGGARTWLTLKALAAVGVLIGVVALTPASQVMVDRLVEVAMSFANPGTLLDPRQGDYERAMTYFEGWNAFLAHPLSGIGYMNLAPWLEARYGWSASSHNLLVTLLAEAGWPAALAFLFLMVRFFGACLSGIRLDPRPLASQFYAAIAIGMIAALMLSMFHQILEFQMFYVLLGMALGAPMLPRGWRVVGRVRAPARALLARGAL
jgi:hypothetical protein